MKMLFCFVIDLDVFVFRVNKFKWTKLKTNVAYFFIVIKTATSLYHHIIFSCKLHTNIHSH